MLKGQSSSNLKAPNYIYKATKRKISILALTYLSYILLESFQKGNSQGAQGAIKTSSEQCQRGHHFGEVKFKISINFIKCVLLLLILALQRN